MDPLSILDGHADEGNLISFQRVLHRPTEAERDQPSTCVPNERCLHYTTSE